MSVDEIVKNTEGRTQGEMIVFISGKGGVGKTVTSVNMAVSLANKGFSTCILDGNFQFGDVNLALNIQPSLTISDIIQETEALESLKISYYLDKHNSGLNVLSAPMKPEQGDLITQFHIKAICKKILEQHDFLIVDLPPGLSENNLTFMEITHKIFLVTGSSLAAVKNTKTMLRTINMLNMNNKIKVIITQSEAGSIINARNAQNVLEVKDVTFISNNLKLVSKSFTMGIPFVSSNPNEKISKEISKLASELYNKI
jgi:pilus assembly protein CpaE